MSEVVGSGSAETFRGSASGDVIFGEGGNDTIRGRAGDDSIHGGGGDDLLIGNAGDDQIFGASTSGGPVDMDRFGIFEDTTATVTFDGETAGFRNALGMYRIDADGNISGVEILFANASLQGSGGNLIGGESSVTVDLNAGERLGFFVVPNGYSRPGMRDLLTDTDGSFQFVDADGNPASVHSGHGTRLVHTAQDGTQTVVQSQYGSDIYHSTTALNNDGYNHVRGVADTAEGTVQIGFEDLRGGGDEASAASVFPVDIGTTHTALVPRASTGGATSSDDDTIRGGQGDDDLFGMRGNDDVRGGQGDDRIWGNSGDDVMRGGAGDDEVYGGSGNDAMHGGAGNDVMEGNTGDDVMQGGAGDDRMSGDSGNDVMRGGAGSDDMSGGSGNDDMSGGSGNDVMRGDAGNDTMRGGAGDDTIFGNSGNDVIYGGRGNDVVDGGSGDDVFIGGAGDDVYRGGSGFDTLDYSNTRADLTVDMSKHTVTGRGNDQIWSVEQIRTGSGDDTIKGDKRDNVIDAGAGDDIIRSMGGADTLTGGAGNDRYVWYAKDIVDENTGAHLGVDHITDFQVGDRIDLHELVKGQSFSDISEVVRVTDGAQGATVSVLLGDSFVDVVTVDGISATDLASDGLILA